MSAKRAKGAGPAGNDNPRLAVRCYATRDEIELLDRAAKRASEYGLECDDVSRSRFILEAALRFVELTDEENRGER